MAVRPQTGSFPGCRACQPRKVHERGARVMKELDRHSVYTLHRCKAIQRLVSWLSHVSAEEGVKLKERDARVTRELERRHCVTYVHSCKSTDRLVQSWLLHVSTDDGAI